MHKEQKNIILLLQLLSSVSSYLILMNTHIHANPIFSLNAPAAMDGIFSEWHFL